jgi:SnoaL-like domain
MDAATQITNLLYAYGNLVDAGDFAGIGELFAHCAVSDASGRLDVRGAEAVTQLYEATTRRYPDTGTPKTKHLIHNPIVEVDEAAGRARTRAHYTVLQATEKLPLQPIIAGHYENEFERVDGAWRFASHRFFVDLIGELGHHLLVSLDAERI